MYPGACAECFKLERSEECFEDMESKGVLRYLLDLIHLREEKLPIDIVSFEKKV